MLNWLVANKGTRLIKNVQPANLDELFTWTANVQPLGILYLKKNKTMKNSNTTSGLMELLLETLDVDAFVSGVRQFDSVTQRQCFLKARRELRKPAIVGLHGQDRAKSAVQAIRTALENAPPNAVN